ncbi:zinc transporter permease [Xylanimonas ulmi]|uniref:zinc transporter permease n=1 Tax=Xylanimonas ulmi TaxID=228973 RepID=UPI00102C5E30|nr:zinc transporter permease [Xylanibacterium ulmi]
MTTPDQHPDHSVAEHSKAAHEHGAGCGHQSVEHDGHVDYVHDGHRHSPHGDHYDEHGAG